MESVEIKGEEVVGLMDLLSEMKELCLAQEQKIQRELSLSPGEYSCLRVFPVSEELDVGALATRLSLSHSRASRIVEKLVQKSLMTRRPSRKDRRAVALKLSSAGVDTKRRLGESLKECETAIYGEMDEDDRQVVHVAFALVRSAMEMSDARD